MAGSKVVPAAGGSAPDWLLGPWRSLGLGAAAGGNGALLFFVALVAAFILYLVVVFCARGVSPGAALVAIIFCQALFLLAPPLLSQDVFSYIAYARLGVEHGLNPYGHVPAEIAGDPILRYVGWRHATSAYGPVFTLATYPLGALGISAAYWILKSAIAVATLGIVLLVRSTARTLGRPAVPAILLVGLNPILLVSVVGGAHNDALAVLVGMFGVLALVKGRCAIAGAWGAVAASVKSSLAVWGAFLVLGATYRARALAGAAVALAAIAAVSLLVFGDHVTGALTAAGENQARVSFYSVPNQVSRAIAALTGARLADLITPVRTAFAVFFVTAFGYLAWRVWTKRGEWLALGGWATFALLIATAWLLPWYLIWLLPFAALASDRRLTVATLALTAYMLPIRVPL